MALLDLFRKRPEAAAEQKNAYSLNSPQLLELIRTGQSSTGSVSVEQAARISTVYSCVKVLSESISTIPCKLYRVVGDQKIAQQDHKLYHLVNRSPNSFMTASEFWGWVMSSVALNGNCFVWMTRTASGTVVELLPLPVSAVSVHVEAQNQITYVVNVGENGVDRQYTVRPEDMLHFKGMTLDGINGISPVQYNNTLLAGAREAGIYHNSMLANGATPSGVLTTDGVLGDDAYERIKASWQAAHGGASNAGKVAILEAGLTFDKVSLSPADIQLLEQRKYGRSEIAGMFRIPPHMLGDLERATFSNITEQTLSFYRDTLTPWLTQFEGRLNHTLLSTSAQEFRFDSTEFLRGDLSTEVSAYKTLLETGVMSPNEIRQRLGMNPRDGGDEFISSTNNLQFGNQNEDQDQEDTPDEADSTATDQEPNK